MPDALFKDDRRGWDAFDRGAALGTLLWTLRTLPAPGCVALYGAWGTGKTTLLHKAYEEWDAKGAAVWFDPWEHEHRGDVVSPLLHAITARIQRDDRAKAIPWKEIAWRIAKTIARIGFSVAAPALAAAAGAPAELGKVDLADLTKDFQKWDSFHNEVIELRGDFQKLVDAALVGQPKDARLAIFLDDLDRCLPESVVALIEAVKLLFFGDGQSDARAVFVFALDRHIVGEAIANRYPRSSLYTGESYLEKIFDVSLEVPAVGAARIDEYLGKLLPADSSRYLDPLGGVPALARVLSEPVFSNPRVVKRTLNRLLLFLQGVSVPAMGESFGKLLAPLEYPAAPPGWDARHRFVAWVAGAERFRTFRLAFFDSSETELKALHSTLRGAPRPMNDALTRLSLMPGMAAYYDALFPRVWNDGEVVAQRSARPAGASATIRDFDDHLRRLGL